MMIWTQPNNKHTWAFIYFCRREGDRVKVTHTCDCNRRLCGHNLVITVSPPLR